MLTSHSGAASVASVASSGIAGAARYVILKQSPGHADGMAAPLAPSFPLPARVSRRASLALARSPRPHPLVSRRAFPVPAPSLAVRARPWEGEHTT